MLSIVAGGLHVCGLNSTDFLLCKGCNRSGQIDVPQDGAFEYDELTLGDEHGDGVVQLISNAFVTSSFHIPISETLIAGISKDYEIDEDELILLCMTGRSLNKFISFWSAIS
ncbi:hypothetical protein KIW84_015373 [Lathyrus oleraceus]|uniref:Uncharacterized protein n=1 Tax=Pisum sativum TaxID=3888 RepID=A0A9D5BQ45_PEA|nr:hypothetical protein KIW84_015373 [Pisum sativum]